MPYAPEHKQATRERIIDSAQRLFARRGFTEVSIDEIMNDAGLTRGGFYNHFATKEDLYAEAVTQITRCQTSDAWGDKKIDFSMTGPPLARQIVEAYLSRQHIDDRDNHCPLIALPSDVARGGAQVKAAYRTVLQMKVGVFEANVQTNSQSARDRALAVAAMCVGGMVLARAVDDEDLGDDIRNAARSLALEAGGWENVGAQ